MNSSIGTRARVRNGAESPNQFSCANSLDWWRRTDAKRGDKTERAAGDLWQFRRNSTDKERNRTVDRADENSGMGHGADRTLMARQLGVVSVYVDRLDEAGEGDQQDT